MAYRNADGIDSDALNQWLEKLSGLLQNISRPEQRKLMRTIGRELQKRNSSRILNNVDPDNVAYVPRKGNAWALRRLRDSETIRRGQRFNFFKEQDLNLKFTRDTLSRNGNPVIVGRPEENGPPDWEADGFVREWIYIKKKGRGAQSKLHMFRKLGKEKWLRYRADEHGAAIGFMQGSVARIAHEHHYGLGKSPARELIGLPRSDLKYIQETLIAHLAKTA